VEGRSKTVVAFGKNVSRLRNVVGLTQEKLAEKADLDRSSLQRIEWGKQNPSVEIIARLKYSLGCSWDDLMRGLKPK
jgi:transcriptional regulator with XRE-family HTH domain